VNCSLRAIIFDLDDTLLVDEALSLELLEELAQQVNSLFQIDPKLFVSDVRVIAQALWKSGECYPFCLSIGISAFEALWGEFLGESEELIKLRRWSQLYREEVFYRALHAQGGEIAEAKNIASSLAQNFSLLRRQRQRLFPETREMLEKLSQHYRLGLLTNGAPDLQREKIAATGCEHFFSAVVISGEYGIGKPNPAIFEHLLLQLEVKPEEAIMVGNSLERDIAGARAAGIASVWIELPEATEGEVSAVNQKKEAPLIVPDVTIHSLSQLLETIRNFDSSLTW
jgi:putative hydrolase of the HAD superfamily